MVNIYFVMVGKSYLTGYHISNLSGEISGYIRQDPILPYEVKNKSEAERVARALGGVVLKGGNK